VPQAAFFKNFRKHPYNWFVGGQSSGKTLTGAMLMATIAMSRPGGRFVVGRWAYKELLTTSWDMLKRVIPREAILGVTDSQQYMAIVLMNGSIIFGWNLSNWVNMASLETDAWWIDEGHQCPDAVALQHLTARNRGPVGPRWGWVTGTPNGFDWEYDIFVRRGLPTHGYVHAATKSNPHNPLEYEPTLRVLYSREQAARFLEAEFTAGGGLVLHPWDPELHVIDSFTVPPHWNRYRSLDPGFSQDQAACLWAATDTEGNLFVYDEYYEKNRVIREQTQEILQQSKGQFFEWTAIDPQANQRNNDTGLTQKDTYKKHGLENLLDGDPRKEMAISAILELLRPDPTHCHPLTGMENSPRLFVMRHCRHTIEEVTNWKRDKRGNPADKNDHLAAALRFLILGRPQPTTARSSRAANELAQRFWQEIAAESSDLSLPLIGNTRERQGAWA
jgi:hypothetical protein